MWLSWVIGYFTYITSFDPQNNFMKQRLQFLVYRWANRDSETHQSRRAALTPCDGNQDVFCEREGSLPCSYFWLQEERAIRNVDEQMCFGSFIITSFLDLLMLSKRGHIPYFRFLSNHLCEIAQADNRVSMHQSTNISRTPHWACHYS